MIYIFPSRTEKSHKLAEYLYDVFNTQPSYSIENFFRTECLVRIKQYQVAFFSVFPLILDDNSTLEQ